MRYLYGVSDEIYPKLKFEDEEKPKVIGPLDNFSFSLHNILKGPPKYDKNDVSVLFKTNPNSLLHLASNVVDKLPLPCAFEWNNWQVCSFIRNLGYPQYQRTFRKNLVTGRKLLLVDAVALSNMNIQNFEHIKHISHCIRCLFYFEMTKFARSISLPSQYYYEFFKLLRTQTGPKYESVRCTDLWKRMQMLRKEPQLLSHFDLLERHLAFGQDPDYHPERISGSPLYGRLYEECMAHKKPQIPEIGATKCECEFLCDCGWNKIEHLKNPWKLSMIGRPTATQDDFVLECPDCLPPPCTCRWRPTMFMGPMTLTTLMTSFTTKYAQNYGHRRSRVSYLSIRSDFSR